MKKIFKVNLVKNTVETVTMFPSCLTRKLEDMGVEPHDVFVNICAETPKNEQTEAVVKSDLAHMSATGYMFNGSIVDPFMAPASKVREATTTWAARDIIPTLGKWAMCGLETKTMKLAINKYMAYIGLLASASKLFKDVFDKELGVRKIAIIKDASVTVEALVDFVTEEGNIDHDTAREIVINAFDGFGIVRKSITNGESVTIRGPWIKAFVQSVDWSKLFAFCVAHGIEAKFFDYWGNQINIKDVDMILTESCFKTVKLYKSWEQYCDAFEHYNHKIAVCVREHSPKLKGLPYQQGQTLLGTEDDAKHFAAHAKKTVYKYTSKDGAPKLLRGAHRVAAGLYPALLTEAYTKKAMQEMYTTKRNDMLGGRIPELGYNAFLAPDLVAFCEHLFGLEIKGYLKAGECYCSNCELGAVDITRNPHFDNAHVVLNNVGSMPMAEGPTMFINIFDLTTIRLRADYDGDHVWYSQDAYLLDLVNRTYEQIRNLPIDWKVGSAEKIQITKSAICSFVTNLIHGSEIGLYADALTKMWNKGYDRDVCAWLTYAGNVLIDAAKHASVKIKKPDAVKALNLESLPLFAMYAKADAEHPAGTDYWLKERLTKTGVVLPPRCKYTGSFLDMYSKLINEEIDETLTVEGLEEEIFDSSLMMFDPHRKLGRLSGLSKKGVYNPETMKFEDCGLFQEIAFRHSTEWNDLIGDTSFYQHRNEWEQEKAKAARDEIVAWVRAKYDGAEGVSDERILQCCHDIILRNVFNTKMSDGMLTVVMQAFWLIFGNLTVKALKTNLSKDDIDFDSEEFEDLFDVTEIEE